MADLVTRADTTGVLWLTPAQLRARILQLEAAMHAEIKAGNLVETTKELPLEHAFIPGAYARSLTIPAGTLIVGKIHRYPCFNFVPRGTITVVTEDGVKRIEPGAFFRSESGVKRVGLAHTDTVWITLHPTEETDPAKLEDVLTFPNYDVALLEAA